MRRDDLRNIAIIADVDHGKSTLADRLLELTGTVEAGQHEEQMLDTNPISRERGITIKLAPVRMKFQVTRDELQVVAATLKINNQQLATSNSEYILNLKLQVVGLMYLTHPRLRDSEAQAIRNALLSFATTPAGKAFLQRGGYGGFADVDGSELRAFRPYALQAQELLRDVR